MKNKKEEDDRKPVVVDFEGMYYMAMQENILLRDKKIAMNLTADEIAYLRSRPTG